LIGDPSRAREKLGWRTKISFEELVRKMVKSDLLVIVLNEKSHSHARMMIKMIWINILWFVSF
jgi:hypothetical protein